VFPPEPPIAKCLCRNGAERSRARRCLARRSEPLTVSTVAAFRTDPDGRRRGNTFPLVSLELSFPTAAPMTAGELARRLITLIYAGRDRMDMIRRELPRTDNAGWIRRSFRTILVEDSPFRGLPAVIGAAVGKGLTTLSCLRQREPRLRLDCDGPHEAE
jgi:hypothetical protein